MEKIIYIDGMTCKHCEKRVETALNNIDGVKAKINLSDKNAIIKTKKDIDNSVLTKAVENAGYKVVEIVNE